MREIILSHDEDSNGRWTTTVYLCRNNLARETQIKIRDNKSYLQGRDEMYWWLQKLYKKDIKIIDELVSEYKYIED